MIRRLAFLGFLLLFAAAPGGAFELEQTLADPALEGRALEINQGLRCLVCQNQSIADSNADLAKDLRRLVRERLVMGESNEEVIAFMVDRYGDFVLLKPPLKSTTYVLWFGPAALLALGAVGVVVYLRRVRARGGVEAAPLSEEERRRLEALIDDQGTL